jgi:hypothetical protein
MDIQSTKKNSGWQLGIAAATSAILVAGSLFGGWFITFIIMRLIGKSLLVGMNYLTWPIVFPLMAFPAIFLLMLFIIPCFRHPYRDILTHRGFVFGVLLPMLLVAILTMLATCPLDNGGTLLTRGWDAFK